MGDVCSTIERKNRAFCTIDPSFWLNEANYVAFGLAHFNYRDFEACHLNIRAASPVSAYGVYSNTVWNTFYADGSAEGVIEIHKKDNRSGSKPIPIGWNDAKKRHEDLLAAILKETYRRKGSARAFVAVILSAVAAGGFLLLLAPAVDLFVAISQSAFSFGPCSQIESSL